MRSYLKMKPKTVGEWCHQDDEVGDPASPSWDPQLHTLFMNGNSWQSSGAHLPKFSNSRKKTWESLFKKRRRTASFCPLNPPAPAGTAQCQQGTPSQKGFLLGKEEPGEHPAFWAIQGSMQRTNFGFAPPGDPKLRHVQMARSKDKQELPVSAQGGSDRSSQGPALQRTLAALVTEETSGHSVL